MTDPLNQATGKDQRRTTEQKVQQVLGVLDLVQTIVRTLLGIFGRRKADG